MGKTDKTCLNWTNRRHKNFKGKKGLSPPLRSFAKYSLCSIYDFLPYSLRSNPWSWKYLLYYSRNENPSAFTAAKISKTRSQICLYLTCNAYVGMQTPRHTHAYMKWGVPYNSVTFPEPNNRRAPRCTLCAQSSPVRLPPPPQQSTTRLLCARSEAAIRTFSLLCY